MDKTQNWAATFLKFALFQGLDQQTQALEDLAEITKHETFEARDFIINENEDDKRMYFLLSGQIVINKMDENGKIVVIGRADEKSNAYFGESILLGKYRKSANVIAHTRCECLSLSALYFEAFMKKHPFVVAAIYRNLASTLFDRLVKANHDILIQARTKS